jgi:hypothetical protein
LIGRNASIGNWQPVKCPPRVFLGLVLLTFLLPSFLVHLLPAVGSLVIRVEGPRYPIFEADFDIANSAYVLFFIAIHDIL